MYIYIYYTHTYIYIYVYRHIIISYHDDGCARVCIFVFLRGASGIPWLKLSEKFPMDVRIPPLHLKIMLDSNPLKSRIWARRLAVSGIALARPGCVRGDRHRLNGYYYLAQWVPSPPGKHTFQHWTIQAVPQTAGKRKARYPQGHIMMCTYNICLYTYIYIYMCMYIYIYMYT